MVRDIGGWNADPERLALLYWDTLTADDRYELVAEAAGALEKETHRFASHRRRRSRPREPPRSML